MKKSAIDINENLVEIPPFDFENSVPNKFAEQYNENAETVIFDSEKGISVVLEPDVAEYFPDSESVNTALRGLILAISKIKKQEFSQETS